MNIKALMIGIILICALFSCSEEKAPESVSGGSNSIYINAIDPTDDDFPGGRGPDELIIYTPSHGIRTGTNQYGLEAIVEQSRVARVEGNNSPIPTNGFVISGHGQALRWISTNLYPGIAVEIKNDSLFISDDVKAKIIYAQYFVDQVLEKRKENTAVMESTRFESFQTLYEDALLSLRSEKNNHNDQSYNDRANRVLRLAKDFYYATFASPTNEIRATWFRITAKSAAELENQIKEIVDVGFNMICPETIYGGYAIFPNAHPDLPQHPQFSGWDPFAELVRLSKKYDLELVPWVWVYHVGRKNSYLAKNKSEWLALSRQKEFPSQVEKGYHFLCPSRKEVRKFWLQVYLKMVKTYEIAGLQLDYIRYPVSTPYDLGYCYCDSCIRIFQEKGYPDPFKINPDTHPKKWEAWNAYRIKQVSQFVADVRKLLNNVKPDVKLSADVFPIPEESRLTKMQDWESWFKKGYLDEIFTMSYTPDAETVKADARLLAEITPKGKKAYVGLGPYQKFRPEILLKEIEYAQEAGADGICLFAFQALTEEQIYALKKGSFRNRARINY